MIVDGRRRARYILSLYIVVVVVVGRKEGTFALWDIHPPR